MKSKNLPHNLDWLVADATARADFLGYNFVRSRKHGLVYSPDGAKNS